MHVRRRSLPTTVASIALFSLTLGPLGCGITTDYLGRSYAPTTTVNIYYAESEINRPFTVMGTARLEAGSSTPVPEFEAELTKLGMAHGAHAVLIENLEFIVVGTTEEFTADRLGNDDRWVSGSSRTRVNRNKVLTARLLRYSHATE